MLEITPNRSNLVNRHSNTNHPYDTGQPRQLQRPDGKLSPQQRPGRLNIFSQPPSHGPTPPASQLQPPTTDQHSAQHAEPLTIKCPSKPRLAKFPVKRSGQRPGVVTGVAATAARESQPSSDGPTEQYASADAGEEVF